MKKNIRLAIKAYFLDVLFHSYGLLVFYKIAYQKILLGLRNPEFSWGQPTMALLIGAIVALALYFVSGFSIGRAIFKLHKVRENRPLFKEPFFIMAIILIALTFIAGILISQLSLREFFSSSGLAGARRIFTSLFNPNWGILEKALFAAIETIYMAFIGTFFAVPIAFLLSFFAARNLAVQSPILFLIYTFTRFLLNLTRAIEPLVWAIIFSVWVGIGPFSGMLALCLHSIASLTKLYSEQIENIDEGPMEAIIATGAHPIQVVWFGVVPQIVLPFLSFTIYRWDINVRMATVIGLVGGGGIGTMLMQYQGLAKWNEVGLLVLLIAFVVWVMDYSSAKIREAIK